MASHLAVLALFLASVTAANEACSCTVTAVSQLAAAKACCTTITLSSVAVPAGQTLDLTGLTTGTTVIFQGTTTFGYHVWAGPLVSASGTKITIQGASGSVLDGQGALWWDGQGSNGGKTKPKFFAAHSLDNSNITGLTIKNSPVQVFSIQSDGLTLSGIAINNADGDSKGGHNTDAFDIGSSNGVYIYNPVVHNQDDCLAINSGQNIIFSGAQCTGGHGISIGSVGGRSDNVVKNTVYGATGSVTGVTYSNIQMSGITNYGVVIEQDYENGSPNGTATNGVPITGLTLNTVTGSVSSAAVPVYILCGSGSCSGWTWKGVSVSGGFAPKKCSNVPSGVSWTGVQCPSSGKCESTLPLCIHDRVYF